MSQYSLGTFPHFLWSSGHSWLEIGTHYTFGSLFFLELEIWDTRMLMDATLSHNSSSWFQIGQDRWEWWRWQEKSHGLHSSCSPTLWWREESASQSWRSPTGSCRGFSCLQETHSLKWEVDGDFSHENKEKEVDGSLQGACCPEVRKRLSSLSQNSSYLNDIVLSGHHLHACHHPKRQKWWYR